MMANRSPETSLRASFALLCPLAAILFAAYLCVGNGYGFHRDELQFLDDARHLHWGFVAYPPITAFFGRISIALFGISPMSFRLPAVVANMMSTIVIGLVAREMGGRLPAQGLASFTSMAVGIALSSLMQYNSFDYLCWSLVTLFTARLLRTEDSRWWLAIGAAFGFGILSKYSIAMLAIGLLAGLILLPSQRRHLRSRHFYIGILVMLLVASPNLIWLATHHFITLQMETSIHARDVRAGRARGYYTDQLKNTLIGIVVVLTGLLSLLRNARYRLLAFFWIGPFLLFAVARGRGYYLLPAYIPLYAGGAVAIEEFLSNHSKTLRLTLRSLLFSALLADMALVGALFLPLAKPLSPWWNFQMKINGDLRDEIGWPELVAGVAAVRDQLPQKDLNNLGVFAGNYGEAGALALYGPKYNLPVPLSHVNSFQLRGLGTPVPETVITVGMDPDGLRESFQSCTLAGQIHIPHGVRNEESVYHPDIYVCHHHFGDWQKQWPDMQDFD